MLPKDEKNIDDLPISGEFYLDCEIQSKHIIEEDGSWFNIFGGNATTNTKDEIDAMIEGMEKIVKKY